MRARKTDDNHDEIRKALRDAGAIVADLSGTGRGIPDFLVGFDGFTHLVEVKHPTSYRGKKLTEAQVKFREKWKGSPIHVVRTPEEAIALLSPEKGERL